MSIDAWDGGIVRPCRAGRRRRRDRHGESNPEPMHGQRDRGAPREDDRLRNWADHRRDNCAMSADSAVSKPSPFETRRRLAGSADCGHRELRHRSRNHPIWRDPRGRRADSRVNFSWMNMVPNPGSCMRTDHRRSSSFKSTNERLDATGSKCGSALRRPARLTLPLDEHERSVVTRIPFDVVADSVKQRLKDLLRTKQV